MEEFNLYIRIFLGFIFLSTGLAKIRSFEKHLDILKNYSVLPKVGLEIIARFSIVFEIILGGFLFVGVFKNVTGIGSILILSVYIITISVNLFKGKREISCGCGGVLGDHNLSWNIVLRNLVLIGLSIIYIISPNHLANISFFLFTSQSEFLFDFNVLVTLLFSVISLVILVIFNRLGEINIQVKTHFS